MTSRVGAGLPPLLDAIVALGVVLIAAGAGLIFLPAGLITGGVLLVVMAVFYGRGAAAEAAEAAALNGSSAVQRDRLRAEVTRT